MTTHGPTQIGGFLVESELGQGGMGVVLLGRQLGLDRPAVLKKLHRDLADSAEISERFDREARAVASLHHPNVVTVYDRFSWHGSTYIAQEYVDGIDLRRALERVRRVPPRIAALILLEAARGLEAIHEHGTVHCDLKPANLLLGRNGCVKIADFGIALERAGSALTQPGVAIGTPAYMPPEQMRGERVDARGDLFSLGVVLYEMLGGCAPYREADSADAEALLSRMEAERYPPLRPLAPTAPRHLLQLVRACLRPRPHKRLESAGLLRRKLERRLGSPSAADVAREIANWLYGSGVIEPREGETERRAPAAVSRRRRVFVPIAALALVCLLALGLLWPRAEPQEPASSEPLDLLTQERPVTRAPAPEVGR